MARTQSMKVLTEKDMMILPPPRDKCQVCAVKHEPYMPHDRDSLYYQMKFHQDTGRYPTWHDAMAHCPDDVKQLWVAGLAEHGVQVYNADGSPCENK